MVEYKEGQLINGIKVKHDLGMIKYGTQGYSVHKCMFECPYCGQEYIATLAAVKNKTSRSCGCSTNLIRTPKLIKHGLSREKCYKEYMSILDRCYNPKRSNYYLYGKRGIKMCDEWKNNILSFCDYVKALPHYYEDGYSLDRIDTNGDYKPENLRYATPQEQMANRRKTGNTPYTGVNPVKLKDGSFRYQSTFFYKGVYTFLGSHSTAEDACIARDRYIINNKLFQYPLQLLT